MSQTRTTPGNYARGRNFARRSIPYLFLAPLTIAMAAWFLAPLASSAVNSFHPFNLSGIDESRWTFANYVELFDPFLGAIVFRTFRIALEICLITTVLAYPTALYISRLQGSAKLFLLLTLIAPWLVNVSIKAAGWMMILSPRGPMNELLLWAGLVDEPVRVLFTETAVVIGLVHTHMFFMVLPLVASLDSIDKNLPLAAANLGARPWAIFWRIIFPLTLPALAVGLILNFAYNISAFATPSLLGGERVPLISHVAFSINLIELNWPLGAALAISLLGATLVLLALARRVTRRPHLSEDAGQ